MKHAVVISALWLCCWAPTARGNEIQLSAQLRTSLLDNYAATLPPDGGVTVALQLALYQIVEVSTPLQTIKFSGWWRHYWHDNRLAWNATYWGIDSMVFSFDEVWSPDDTIYEVIQDTPSGEAVITAYPDGSMFYSAPRVSLVGCNMDLEAFPFDTQTCHFTVGSLAYDAQFVDIIPREVSEGWWSKADQEDDAIKLQPKTSIDLYDYSPNPEYSLISVKVISRNNVYSCCVYPFPVIKYELRIERQTLTYVSGIILPLICVTCVGFLALLMPAPMSGARPTLSVSIAFTTSSIYLVASQKLPEVGTWTLIGRLYLASMGASLLMTCLSIISTGVNMVSLEEKNHRADLLNAFKAADSDKSGTLDEKEVVQALRGLGLTPEERDRWIEAFQIDSSRHLTQDEWMDMAELQKNYRPLTQYNFIVAKLLQLMLAGHPSRQAQKKASSDATDKSGGKRQGGRTASADKPVDQKELQIFPANGIRVNGHNFGNEASEQTPRIPALPVPRDSPPPTAPAVLSAEVGFEKDFQNASIPNLQEDSTLAGFPAFGLPGHNSYSTFILEDTEAGVAARGKLMSERRDSSPELSGIDDENLLMEWLSLLGLPDTAFLRFQEQEIDVEALSQLQPMQLETLGVRKMGHQSKLVAWAKHKMEERKAHMRPATAYTAGFNAPSRTISIDKSSPTKGNGQNGRTAGSRAQSGDAGLDIEKRLSSSASINRAPSFVRKGSFIKQKEELEKRTKSESKRYWMSETAKHFGATIDFYSFLVVPTLFIVYLICEFGGLFITGNPTIKWFTKASEQVETIVRFADRTHLSLHFAVIAGLQQQFICFRGPDWIKKLMIATLHRFNWLMSEHYSRPIHVLPTIKHWVVATPTLVSISPVPLEKGTARSAQDHKLREVQP